MQLWHAYTSPFARKVRIVAHELGISSQLTLTETNPWTDGRLRPLNPLAKVPTLVLDDGGVLYESAVICEYLDATCGQGKLFPSAGDARWRALMLQALADGACGSATRLFADEHRAPTERSDEMMARLKEAVEAGLDALEAHTGLNADAPTIGEISVAAFLGYLDFRWPDRDWRATRPALARFAARIEERPSLRMTRLQRPTAASRRPI